MVTETTTYYFEKKGVDNTERLLQIVKKKAVKAGINHVVVASTRGETGIKAAETFQGTGITVVVVTHQTGHGGPGIQQLTNENRRKLEKLGAKIITGTDALTGGVGLGISYRAPPVQPDEAQNFVDLNTGIAVLTPIEQFKASVVAGNFVDSDISAILSQYGFKVGSAVNQSNSVAAVKALRQTYRQLGRVGFDRMISLLYKTWSGNQYSTTAKMLKGTALLVQKAGKMFSDDEFTIKLRRFSPMELNRDGRGYHYDNARQMARVLLDAYNKGRSTGRIPESILD